MTEDIDLGRQDDARSHARRASSFGARAAAYHQHRPDYPSAAIEWLLRGLRPPARVLDLAAGTGKLTASLVSAGHDVIAVEPDDAMRAELTSALPGVSAFPGTAEDIPLPDSQVNAVVVGQAFHWFDADRALPEIARVLVPGGILGALWNYHDETVPWVAGLRAAAQGRDSWARDPRGRDIPPHPKFVDHDTATFEHRQRRTVETLVETSATHSDLLVRDEHDRAEVLARIEAYLRSCPHTAEGEFDVPLRTIVVRVTRRVSI